MTTKHFLTNGIDLYDHHGFNVDNPDDRLHGKIVGLLFCGDFGDSQLQSFVHHLRPFFNRVNGCDPATKEYTGKRGHVLDIVVVPGSTASDDNVREFLQKVTCPPFLHISPEHGGEIYKREAFGFEGGEELALVIVNFDGSVISPTGIVDILSKGDSCLMGWQMKRKNEPVGGGEAGVREEVKLNGAVGSRTIVGGVALDLPF